MAHRLTAVIRGNLVAWLALFVALGGTSLAASHFVISSTNQISPKVIKKLKGNQGATGPRGIQGPAGPPGASAVAGTLSASSVFNKSESDARYLSKDAEAQDSVELEGVPASGYTTGDGSQGARWQALGNSETEPDFLFVPLIGQLATSCNITAENTGTTGVKLTQHAGGAVFLTWGSYGKGAPAIRTEATELKQDDESLEQTFAPAEKGTGQMIIQATIPSTTVHASATITVSASIVGTECRFQANYMVAFQPLP
jgi:hypothetical protein